MGLRSNFSQAMRELKHGNQKDGPGNTVGQDNASGIKDIAAYMNDSNDDEIRDLNIPSAPTANPAAAPTPPPTSAAASPLSTSVPPIEEDDEEEEENTRQMQIPTHFGQESYRMSEQTRNLAEPRMPQRSSYSAANFAPAFRESASQQPQSSSRHTPFDNYESTGENDLTTISKNTIIDGNIRAFGDMDIKGSVKGNIETTKNLTISGKIAGDISCDNANFKSASIQGNITLKGQINMSNDSMLIGDLSSQSAYLNGKVKGNLNISGKLQLDKNSVVFGDVRAGAISVADGAILEGRLCTTYLSKDESSNIFPDNIPMGD